MKIELNKIKNFEPIREVGNVSDLKSSIQQIGLLEPLVVTPDYSLIAGHRRYKALKELNINEVEIIIKNPANKYEEFLMALHENIKRKNLTWQEEVVLELQEKKLYEEQFPETKRGGDRKSDKIKLRNIQFDIDSYVETKAKIEGISPRTIYENVQLARALEEHPELERIKRKSFAKRALKQKQRQYEIDRIPKQELTGKYNIILADPPWDYDTKATALRGRASDHYPTMTIEEIRDLKVKDITLENAVLFLWTTAPMIKKGFSVVEAWGFEFKTSMVWIKDRIGIGFYVRSKHEIILIGIKGKFLPMTTDLPESVFYAAKGSHSSKPEIIYEIIEKMYPGQKYMELFKRGEKRKNWDCWGIDVSSPYTDGKTRITGLSI